MVGVGDLQGPALVADPTAPNGKLLALDPTGPPSQRPEPLSGGWNNPFAFVVTAGGDVWVADNAPGDGPERIGRGDRQARGSEPTDLPGRRAPAALVEVAPGRLGLCGYLDGGLTAVDVDGGEPRPGHRLATGCRTGAAVLADGRLAVSDGERVRLLTEPCDRYRRVAMDDLGFGLSERPGGYGYTIEEHVRVVGELVDQLGHEGLVVMGQDWGGPIGTGLAVERADRIRGLVLGNTWFWPADRPRITLFSRLMSTRLMQRQILERNLFVERLLPGGMTRKLTPEEMDHYRMAQPSPEARRGVAEMPRQILAARPLLERLAQQVPDRLGTKPALLVWGMKEFAFRPRDFLPRMRATFHDHVVVEFPDARHYIQEDGPDEIASANTERFP